MPDLQWIRSEGRFEYLDRDDSKLYAAVKDSKGHKDRIIKHLLEKLASSSRSAHVSSNY